MGGDCKGSGKYGSNVAGPEDDVQGGGAVITPDITLRSDRKVI